jgi:hypothetical protein
MALPKMGFRGKKELRQTDRRGDHPDQKNFMKLPPTPKSTREPRLPNSGQIVESFTPESEPFTPKSEAFTRKSEPFTPKSEPFTPKFYRQWRLNYCKQTKMLKSSSKITKLFRA